MESWLRAQAAMDRSRNTLTLRRFVLRAFTAWLREQGVSERVAELTRADVEEYLIDLRRDYADNTVWTYHTTLAAFFNWCVREEELDYSPMARLPKPKVADAPPDFLTPDEVRAMLRTCASKSFMDRRDRAILLLLIDTGMRCHEVAALQLDAIDWTAGTVTFVGKGKRPRTPHFDKAASDALDAYKRARTRYVAEHPHLAPSQAFWLGRRGALTSRGVYELVKRRARMAGLDGVHPHLFRHGFANDWLAGGGTEGDLARLAGWTPGSRVLHRYGAAQAEERAREAHKRLSPANRLLQR